MKVLAACVENSNILVLDKLGLFIDKKVTLSVSLLSGIYRSLSSEEKLLEINFYRSTLNTCSV
jgi:hypothetical protein